MRAILLGLGLAAASASVSADDPAPPTFSDLEFSGADSGSVKLPQL